MAGIVRAVVDVGTNSVKLLVAEVEGTVVRPLFESSNQTPVILPKPEVSAAGLFP